MFCMLNLNIYYLNDHDECKMHFIIFYANLIFSSEKKPSSPPCKTKVLKPSL